MSERIQKAIQAWRDSKLESQKAWDDWLAQQAKLANKHGGSVKSRTGWYYKPDGTRSASSKGNKPAHPDGDECERLYESMRDYGYSVSTAASNIYLAFVEEYGEDIIRAVAIAEKRLEHAKS